MNYSFIRKVNGLPAWKLKVYVRLKTANFQPLLQLWRPFNSYPWTLTWPFILHQHSISRFRYFYGHETRGIISDAAWRDYEIIQWIELSGSICLLQFAHVRKDWSLTFFDFDYFGSTMIDCWFLSIWFLFFAQQIHTEIHRIQILHQNQGFTDGYILRYFTFGSSKPCDVSERGLVGLSASPWFEDSLESALNSTRNHGNYKTDDQHWNAKFAIYHSRNNFYYWWTKEST